MELQQSPIYENYIKSIGWRVTKLEGINIFHRQIFLMGGIAKIQRCDHLPDLNKLINLLKNNHIFRLALEPAPQVNQLELNKYCQKLKQAGININSSAFIPTKTIIVDISKSEDEIIKSFTEAKRRAVRKAQKNGVYILESSNIKSLISIKDESAGLFGFIVTSGQTQMWNNFYPNHASILLAYTQKNPTKIIGGILLIIWEKIGYYWIAGATRPAKKLFAPTLLAWEAIKTAKKYNCNKFDFVGVWDERMPRDNRTWLGFTKFKEGFGGQNLYYPVTGLKNNQPFK
jgi:lipid II:glycine glycyltransferase (peptidoglycan interpeptide bridge formation enzyme)